MKPGWQMRPAREPDAAAIRGLIRRVRINPLGLDWRRFLVAVDEQGKLTGCGQIKPHADGSRELASIAVEPAARGEGIARAVIERLLAGESGPLYLTCRPSLEGLYRKFGFRALKDLSQMPPYFRTVSRLGRIAGFFLRKRRYVLVMVRGPKA